MYTDAVSERRIMSLHPLLREEAMALFNDINNNRLTGDAKMRVTRAYASFSEQDELYAQGRTKPGKIVTNARGGDSYHNYGLALDFCLLLDNGRYASWDTVKDYDGDHTPDWMEVVYAFTDAGWEWAGTWKTFIEQAHVQKTFGYSIQALKKEPFGQDGYVRIVG